MIFKVKIVKRHHLLLKYSCVQFKLRSAGSVAKPALECNDTQIHRYCGHLTCKEKQGRGKNVIKLITNILNKLKA